MTYLFHIVLGLLVIVCRTTILQQVELLSGLYDLLIVQVVYLALYRPLREGLIILIVFGFAMDGLTGGSYGVYLTTYLWIFACVRWALTLFRLSNTLITPFVVAFGVLLENIVHLIGSISLDSFFKTIINVEYHAIIFQLIWALLTGPLMLACIKILFQNALKWRNRIIVIGHQKT